MKITFCFFLILSFIVVSCQVNIKVKDMWASSAQYDGKIITASDLVVSSGNIPFLTKYYTLKVDAGEVVVYPKSGKQNVPNEYVQVTEKVGLCKW